jgi:hypothetical protein
MITPETARQRADIIEYDGFNMTAKLIRDLAQQIEEMQEDAMRYRWLRNHSSKDGSLMVVQDCYWRGAGDCDPTFFDDAKELDSAIDEAMK